jgi:hypothetical protein
MRQKVAVSIPNEVTNPSSLTVALGSTQPLTDRSTRNLPGGKGVAGVTTICEPTV